MFSYDQALAVAKRLKPSVDACDEYNNAFLFKCKAEEWEIGGDGPVVILKETGKAINQVVFFDQYRPERIREFEVKK